MERPPLFGLRVVAECSSLAGRLVARNLGDMGADVVILEPPTPDGADRTAMLRNVYSAGSVGASERSAMLHAATIIVGDAVIAEADAPDAVRVVIPGGLDESTDLPFLVATMAVGAICVALYQRRRTGEGIDVTLDSDAIAALLRLGGGDRLAAPHPSDPRQNAHLRARGFWEPVSTPSAATDIVEIAASPWLIGGVGVHTRTPGPLPGEHADLMAARIVRSAETRS